MVVDGQEFEISRHTEPERFWTMGTDAETLFRARKMGVFSRKFEISGVGGDAVLKGVSALGRTMVVKGPQIDCAISTEFCWSRRIAVRGIWEDFRFVAFAFWLSYQTRISRWG